MYTPIDRNEQAFRNLVNWFAEAKEEGRRVAVISMSGAKMAGYIVQISDSFLNLGDENGDIHHAVRIDRIEAITSA